MSKNVTEEGSALCLKEEPSLIIGVDFGTTWTGVSYAFTATPDNIHVIRDWPGNGNRTSEKVPSEIVYTHNESSSEDTYKWGFQATGYLDRIQWIKLLLDPGQNEQIAGLSSLSNNLKKQALRGKSAVHIVTDFFRGLKIHMDNVFERAFGHDFIDANPTEYVFTVPAIWSDKAKNLTLVAARAANFVGCTPIRVITEPEAAAICSINTMRPTQLNVGDSFCVVDCGGGTVDLISYEIEKIQPQLEVFESAVGSGGLCGSVYINRGFQEMVIQKIGVESFDRMSNKAKDKMMKDFDEVTKRSFSNAEDEEIYMVPVPGLLDNPDAGVEEGFLVLTREELCGIFDPVLKRITTLIEGQVDSLEKSHRKIKAILLVGGFGSSQYLRAFVQKWSIDHGDIEVVQPLDAWSAIARGAVMRGLQGDTVSKRLARRAYGIHYSATFIDGVHPVKDRYWDPISEMYMCGNRAKWFNKKGDQISEDNIYEEAFALNASVKNMETYGSKLLTNRVIAFDGDDAPDSSDAVGVYTVCSMLANMNSAPKSLWKCKPLTSGEHFFRMNFNVRMVLEGAILVFEANALGKTYGTVDCNFE